MLARKLLLDRVGEITPPVERGNGLHQQRDAGEIPERRKISDLLHRRAAADGMVNESGVDDNDIRTEDFSGY